MYVEVGYLDQTTGKYETVRKDRAYKLAWDMLEYRNGFYQSYPWNILVKDEESPIALLSFKIAPGYPFCCGLREIGKAYSERLKLDDVEEARNKVIDFLKACTVFHSIGALTFTCIKDIDGEPLQEESLVAFIEDWPGASAGNWWYNPNSGNMVRQWTLPINQGKKGRYQEDDDDYLLD